MSQSRPRLIGATERRAPGYGITRSEGRILLSWSNGLDLGLGRSWLRSRPFEARFALDAPLRLDRADPEFEALPAPTLRLRDFDPRDHQRLVVNPFLAVFGLIALAWALCQRNHFLFEPVNLVLLVALFGLRFLIEYHCLDCGQTGRLVHWKQHACPKVVARWNSDRNTKFPTARTQLFVWGWLLGSVAVLLLVLAWE